ncbi:MAG: site-specific integrase [Marmoricola sp.]
MSSGKLRNGIIKRGNTYSYTIRVTDPVTGVSRPRWVGGFKSESAAKKARDEARVAAERGKYIDRNDITVTDYLRTWLANHALEIKPKTQEDYRAIIERYLVPRLGHMRMQAVRPVTISTFYATLLREGGVAGRPLSARTVSYVHSVLRKAFNDAVLIDQILDSNPVERAKRPRAEVTQLRHPVWDAKQLRLFLDEIAEHRLLPFFRLAAYTGARRGELLYLPWSNVHLEGDDPYVLINGAITIVRGHRVEGTTKTGRSRRVSLDPGTVKVLIQHREQQAREREQMGPQWPSGDWVFRMESGKPLRVDLPGELLRAAIKEVNLAAHEPRSQADDQKPTLLPIRLHDLRHVHATLLLKGGVPVHVVAARLGHADPAMTLRVYAHVLSDQGASAASTFAALMDRPKDD